MSMSNTDKAQLIKQDHLLQAVINAVPAPIFYKNSHGCYLGCNKAFEEYVGLSKKQLIGKTAFELFDLELALIYDEADKKLLEQKAPQVYETQVRYADGSLRDVIFHKAVFNAVLENIDGIVGVILDVTERKQAQKELEKLAITDSLTGLVNRYFIVKELEKALLRADRTNNQVAFLMLDLDNFKTVNDTYGHPTGDALIVDVAKRILSAVRGNDVVARIGGDEFAILLDGENVYDMAQNVAQKVLTLLHQTFVIDEHHLNIGVSIGIATSNGEKLTASDIMKSADIAMYEVKERGKGDYQFCH